MEVVTALSLVGALAVAPLHAQVPDPWTSARELRGNAPVLLTTISDVLVEGWLIEAAEKAATTGDERHVPSAEPRTVRVGKRDSNWNGLLAGAAFGFGGGAGLGALWFHGSGRYGAKPPGYARGFISGTAVVGSVVGALIGWRIDAARNNRDVIHEAPPVP